MWSEMNRRCDERCSSTSEKKMEGKMCVCVCVGGATAVYPLGTEDAVKLIKGKMGRKRAGTQW